MKDTRTEIREWVAECMDEVEQNGALSAILLCHIDGRGVDIDIFTIKAGSYRWGKAEEMGDAFYRFAQRHAGGYTGAQQFKLSAMYGVNGAPSRFLPFGMHGVLTYGPGGGSTEPPTPTGQIQQGMRLTEIIAVQAFQQNSKNAETQDKFIERLLKRVTELELENREMWIALKMVLLDMQKERMADRLKALSAQRLAELQKTITMMAPALINMMAGKEIIPLNPADTSLIDGIAASATQDQVQMITTWLASQPNGSIKASMITDRYNSFHKRRAEEAVADARALAGLETRPYEEAERDAMGEAMRALRGPKPSSVDMAPAVKALAEASLENVQQVPTDGVQYIKPPRENFNDAENLLADLFEKVAPEKVEMVIGMLGMEHPELASKMKELQVSFQKS